MTLFEKLCLAVGVLASGFLAGRMSVRVDDQGLRDSLAVYRESRVLDRAALDRANAAIRQAAERVAVADAEADRLRVVAERSEARAAGHGRRADSLLALLPMARTAADSNAILVPACTERRQECAELRFAVDTLRGAAAEDSAAKAGLRTQLAVREEIRGRDSLALMRGERLIARLERNVRGCRVPLVATPCPAAQLSYDLTDRSFHAGAGIPLTRWLTVSVTTKVSHP